MSLTGELSVSMFDKWSLAHLATGLAFGYSGKVSPLIFLGVHTAWEIWENSESGISAWNAAGWPAYRGDSKTNMVGDTVSAMAGFVLGSFIGSR